jgi:hypothetical protein
MTLTQRELAIEKYRIPPEIIHSNVPVSGLLIFELEEYLSRRDCFDIGEVAVSRVLEMDLYTDCKGYMKTLEDTVDFIFGSLASKAIERNFKYTLQKVSSDHLIYRAKTREEFREAAKAKHIWSKNAVDHLAGSMSAMVNEHGIRIDVEGVKILKSPMTGHNFTEVRLDFLQ